jgi:DNA-directed RNA polymerase subunit RPC12/RpoP
MLFLRYPQDVSGYLREILRDKSLRPDGLEKPEFPDSLQRKAVHFIINHMAVRCLYCNRQYDITLFEFDRSIACVCGHTVTFKHEKMTDEALWALRSEDSRVREIRGMADRIASFIVGSDYPMIDVEIEKQKLRARISELFPDRLDLYDLIYEPRFRRLKEQFRE